MQAVIFYGPPACGKGTHASKLRELTKWPIIDAGKEFRTIVATENSALSKRIKHCLDSDIHVETEDYLEVISKIIHSFIAKKQSFIMDRGGAMKSEAQCISDMLEKAEAKVSLFHLPLTLEESIQRSLERYFVAGVNQGFESYEEALKHCSDGQKPFKRDDDTSKEKIMRRYKDMYSNNKTSVLSIYSHNKFSTVYEVGSHHTIEESFTSIKKHLSL
jgi:adenylate kinase family enzyme